jgi:hypothetical protein
MRADDARGKPERHLAHLELTAERKHLAAALAFIRIEANRPGLGAAETSRLERKLGAPLDR